jgi:hypothetical protein
MSLKEILSYEQGWFTLINNGLNEKYAVSSPLNIEFQWWFLDAW